MLKVFILVLIIAGFSSVTYAQLPQEQREAPPMEQLPQEQMQREILYEDQINKDELPEGVKESLKDTWPDYEIVVSYRGSDGSIKVNLEKGDEKVAAFYDAEGGFLRVEEDNDEDEIINDDWR